jgi:formamidopyrimidine-DNA glycosylase
VWAVPELPEVESYRRLAERLALGRTIEGIDAPDAWYLKGGLTAPAAQAALVGRRFTDANRRGKLLLLASDGSGPVLGLRFGMTGRLIVDGIAGVEDLWYAPKREEVRWSRFGVHFEDGGLLAMQDPRRLGGVTLDPAEDRLGPDALTVTKAELRRGLATSRAPLKAWLLNQAHLAGVGNLIADEALWRAGLSPVREARSLTDADVGRLHRHLKATITEFINGGGSHLGKLMEERRPGGVCPKDGNPLVRATVGGRTTWYCPAHQR